MEFVYLFIGFIFGNIFLAVMAAVWNSGRISRMEEQQEKQEKKKKFEFDVEL